MMENTNDISCDESSKTITRDRKPGNLASTLFYCTYSVVDLRHEYRFTLIRHGHYSPPLRHAQPPNQSHHRCHPPGLIDRQEHQPLGQLILCLRQVLGSAPVGVSLLPLDAKSSPTYLNKGKAVQLRVFCPGGKLVCSP